jgi:hypothetical protein
MGVLAKEAYQTYLESNHWKELRQLVLDQLDYRCCICYRQHPGNEVHHIYYCGNWYKTLPHHLTVLCGDHHDELHKHIPPGGSELKPSEHFERFYRVREHLRSMCLGGLITACCRPDIQIRASKRPQTERVLNKKEAKLDWQRRKRQRWQKWQKLTDAELTHIESIIELVTKRKIIV